MANAEESPDIVNVLDVLKAESAPSESAPSESAPHYVDEAGRAAKTSLGAEICHSDSDGDSMPSLSTGEVFEPKTKVNIDKILAKAGIFGLIPVSKQLAWKNALAHHVLNELTMSDWKKQEQLEPMNATIACLVRQGMTDPAAISTCIVRMGSIRSQDAPI